MLRQFHLLLVTVEQKESLILERIGLAGFVKLWQERVVFDPLENRPRLKLIGEDLRQAGLADPDRPFDDDVLGLRHWTESTRRPKACLDCVILPANGEAARKNRPDVSGRLPGRTPDSRRAVDLQRISVRRSCFVQAQLLRARADPCPVPESLAVGVGNCALHRHRPRRGPRPPATGTVHALSRSCTDWRDEKS